MKKIQCAKGLAACLVVSLLAGRASQAQPVNIALSGTAIQSTDYPCCGGFPGPLAIDGNYSNFTATAPADEAPTWEVDLGADAKIDQIVVYNRGDGCCQSRLRDIVVSIHDVSFLDDPASSPLFETEILNEENTLGGGTLAGPLTLTVDISPAVTGHFVRVARIPDPDLSGTAGEGGGDEVSILSIGEVEIFGDVFANCPQPAAPEFKDTHCTLLAVEGPAEGGPGVYNLTATATDGAGDEIFYSFRADNGFNPPIIPGRSSLNSAQIMIPAGGRWTFSVTVDDSLLCDDEAADVTCTKIVDVLFPESDNRALFHPTRQSSDYGAGAFPASLAVDGDPSNFTVTAPDDADAYWEVDLTKDIDIASILVRNRGDGCCQSRLRDITVSIRDATGNDVIFESELLNAENVLGGGSLSGPPVLSLDLVALTGARVTGRVVRVHRMGDPDLSGTGGQGNPDEANVLSIGEVEVFDTACGEGVARCTGLIVDGPGGDPGLYTATATATEGAVFYTFRAQRGVDPPLVVGPSEVSVASFNLEEGDWTVTVSVGDSSRCENTAEGATCTQGVTVNALCNGENAALTGVASQSSEHGSFPAPIGNDGDRGNFTATAPDDLAPQWQVDLGLERAMETIVVYNRGDGCCQERLRDITISILDATGAEVEYQSELLNPGNVLGGPPYLLVKLAEEVGLPVNGQIVRVSRTPDPGSSGDDAALLSIGEVEVCVKGPRPGTIFHRGDADDNGILQLTDAIRILGFLFLGGPAPSCLDAADADDNGTLQLTDAIRVLGYLFLGAAPPASPGPPDQPCGLDAASEDPDLGCAEYSHCN